MRPVNDLAWLNSLTAEKAVKELLQCCGSMRWATQMSNDRPYSTLDQLITHAGEVWRSLTPTDWLEAFRSHPKIGEKKASDNVSAQSQQWSGQEQAGVSNASQQTVDSLAELNRAYERRFGFIFIICASGKSSGEMLAALQERLQNDSDIELRLAAAEQAKITELRLKKLLS
ncbi:MAG TPA: 2-oxo-4-hydroxy-4-carboxy-5-ureidoimidazoline decarboxylase [Pyrinomonadaceae bacterium]|jgi:OHCU decarboxylase|nr:2-oxo-4-hydroxy-4-carboxy-5-ureidoimidazoline decarboxylase [Pyrinomonadaceae bacterium]